MRIFLGYTPFPGRQTNEVQQKIRELNGEVEFPKRTFSANAK